MPGFPRLAGQHADYLLAQLAAFADGSRANPVMGAMARNLSAQDAQRLAAYLAAL
jgi:cytochrome c553